MTILLLLVGFLAGAATVIGLFFLALREGVK